MPKFNLRAGWRRLRTQRLLDEGRVDLRAMVEAMRDSPHAPTHVPCVGHEVLSTDPGKSYWLEWDVPQVSPDGSEWIYTARMPCDCEACEAARNAPLYDVDHVPDHY